MSALNAEHQFLQDVDDLKVSWSEPRWRNTKRRWTAEQIVSKRGSLNLQYPSNAMSLKLYQLLEDRFNNRQATTTFGCLDPIMLTQMVKYVDTIYVSGWQSSVSASSSDEPGPDLADYPYTTLPDKVGQLFTSQLYHDRKQRSERLALPADQRFTTAHTDIDYLRPLIADADTGHGGLTATMKLTKLFVEKGAAAIHIEDKATGLKGGDGTILVPICEHLDRLAAVRAQADIMGVNLLIIARTDALHADHITSVIDDRDHEFVLGVTVPNFPALASFVQEARRHGRITCPADLKAILAGWTTIAGLKTYNEAVVDCIRTSEHLQDKDNLITKYLGATHGVSNCAARAIARDFLGKDIFFDWDLARTPQGLYKYKDGAECAINRAIAFAPFSDMIWPSCYVADYDAARQVAKGIHAVYPDTKLAWNLATAYDWNKHMSLQDQSSHIQRLAQLGYCWQHMTTAGFTTAALATRKFAKAFAEQGVPAYASRIQAHEDGSGACGDVSVGCDNWAGASFTDDIVSMVRG